MRGNTNIYVNGTVVIIDREDSITITFTGRFDEIICSIGCDPKEYSNFLEYPIKNESQRSVLLDTAGFIDIHFNDIVAMKDGKTDDEIRVIEASWCLFAYDVFDYFCNQDIRCIDWRYSNLALIPVTPAMFSAKYCDNGYLHGLQMLDDFVDNAADTELQDKTLAMLLNNDTNSKAISLRTYIDISNSFSAFMWSMKWYLKRVAEGDRTVPCAFNGNSDSDDEYTIKIGIKNVDNIYELCVYGSGKILSDGEDEDNPADQFLLYSVNYISRGNTLINDNILNPLIRGTLGCDTHDDLMSTISEKITMIKKLYAKADADLPHDKNPHIVENSDLKSLWRAFSDYYSLIEDTTDGGDIIDIDGYDYDSDDWLEHNRKYIGYDDDDDDDFDCYDYEDFDIGDNPAGNNEGE